MASASATVFANGFSHRTCLPASSAAMAISACVSPGVQMSMTSMSGRSTSSLPVGRREDCHPRVAAARLAASASRPQSATMRGDSGRSKTRPAVRHAWEWAAPMKA